ncbi:bacterio-opsin activator domain-containing protein [Natrialbaceae archaeon A-arb3/5]
MSIPTPRVDDTLYEEVIAGIPEGVVCFEESGLVVFTNRAAADLLGYEPDELIERPIAELVATERRETIGRLMNRATTDETISTDLSLAHRNGRRIPVTLALKRIGGTDQHRFVAAFHERPAREKREPHEPTVELRALLERSADGMAITDENDVYTFMNDVHANLFGYDDGSELVGTSWKRLFSASEVERFEAEVRPVLSERGSWRGEAIGTRANGDEITLEITLSTLEDGGLVCIVRDISERKANERQLEQLNDVARELMSADDVDAIGRIGIGTVEDVLGFDRACLRLLDDETKRLECVSPTADAEALVEAHTAYDLEATLAGRAFREGRTVIDRLPADASAERGGAEYPSVHVPIGARGVLSIVLGTDETVDDRDVHLAEMLTVNVGTAIDRAERVQLLRTHEHEMRQQRDHLEAHNRINRLVQEIGRQLIEATTREELEQTICDRLANSELYHSAWIGDIEASTDRVTTRVGAAISDRDLAAINEMSVSSIGNGAVERMIETGSVEVVTHYRVDRRHSGVDDSATEPRSTAAVPLAYGDRLFGVLVVNGTGEEVVSDETLLGFESLGKVTGFAINAIRDRTLLLSDSVIELEFEITDPESFYFRVSSELGCECRFERSVPIEGRKVLNYHTITGSDPATVLEVAATAEEIEDARVVQADEDRVLLQTLTSSSTVHIALEGGATLRSAVVTDGEARIVLEVPQTANVRGVVSVFEESFERVDLVAKRERDRSIQTAAEFRQTVDSGITEKQRSAIESAYAAGYYDWPRAITAEELAESMEISPATLHQHLRKGIQGLLSAFLDENASDGAGDR